MYSAQTDFSIAQMAPFFQNNCTTFKSKDPLHSILVTTPQKKQATAHYVFPASYTSRYTWVEVGTSHMFHRVVFVL